MSTEQYNALPLQPFADNMEHLLAELARLDLCLRAQVAAQRSVLAADPALRGLYISDEEVMALLQRPVGRPAWMAAQTHSAGLLELRTVNAKRVELSLQRGVALRLPRLQQLLGLGPFETDALLLSLAAELDLRYERVVAWLHDDITRKRVSVGLLVDLLASGADGRLAARRSFEPGSPLRHWQLIGLVDDPIPGGQPLLARAVKVDEGISTWLLGSDAIDERLQTTARLHHSPEGLSALVLAAPVRQALQGIARRSGSGQPLVVHMAGLPGAGQRTAAAALAHEWGHGLLELDLGRALAEGRFESLVLLAERESLLQGALLYASGFDALLAAPQRPLLEAWLRRLALRPGPVFLAGRHPFEPAGDVRALPFVRVELPPLDVAQRALLWRTELPMLEGAGVDAAVLAGKFKFGPEQLLDAAATVRRCLLREPASGGQGAAPLNAADVHEACRLHSNQQLTRTARKVTPRYRWSDIVLPADRLTMLRDICNHMKYRGQVYGDWGFGRKLAMGKGLSVLFAGPSGTGKTMAAEIIAGELGLDLFKIDLSSVISKYIGETEKNLGSLFDEAETSNAILFFDEADALFGKRTEVRDSHDRYANVEVGYLLQRLEEYEGVAILATNFRKNMDEAFVRRLHFTVEFPFPGPADRRSIWLGVWPMETPRDESISAEDLGRRFEMTGGNIRNVALAAAFLAADDGGPVQIGHVMRATQREFQKMGKLIDDKAFVAPSH